MSQAESPESELLFLAKQGTCSYSWKQIDEIAGNHLGVLSSPKTTGATFIRKNIYKNFERSSSTITLMEAQWHLILHLWCCWRRCRSRWRRWCRCGRRWCCLPSPPCCGKLGDHLIKTLAIITAHSHLNSLTQFKSNVGFTSWARILWFTSHLSQLYPCFTSSYCSERILCPKFSHPSGCFHSPHLIAQNEPAATHIGCVQK